jgi:hypothetical protein
VRMDNKNLRSYGRLSMVVFTVLVGTLWLVTWIAGLWT